MEDKLNEKQKIIDEGFLTRSLIENEVAAKKCQHYSEIANDSSVKAFFKDQSNQLCDAQSYLRDSLSELK